MPFPDLRPVYPFLIPNGRFADVEIVCARSKIRVHKVVLCGAASAFEAAIKPGIRVCPDQDQDHERAKLKLRVACRLTRCNAPPPSVSTMLIALRKRKRDQVDFQKYDWDSAARVVEWVYYGGYQTPSEKKGEARKKGPPEQNEDGGEVVGEVTAEELRRADLKLHFGIVKIAKDFKIDVLLASEKSSIFGIMESTPDITTLVLYLNLLHKVASDDDLMSFGATKVSEQLSELVGDPVFESIWLPGSFYKTILDRCSQKQRPQKEKDMLLPAEDDNEETGDPVVKRNVCYANISDLELYRLTSSLKNGED
ncbi:hypothetical protein KEM56_002874 [Ascosphaera pollenicola]|nr:hypothetical protein KEM56_002874 [Ascosphaera pollenicola]